MTKLPSQEIKAPPGHLVDRDRALQERLEGDLDNPGALFLESMRKAAGFQRKDFEYGMRVSKTLVREWFDGTKADPLTRARHMVALFRAAGKTWLIPVILEYVAGSDFDGRVLSGDQVEALRKLAEVVQ